MPGRERRGRIVFAGGGHAHLHSLVRVGSLIRRGFEVTLVAPSPYLYYSGMATGVISGSYAPDEHRIDVRGLVEAGGGSFVEDRVSHIQAEDRTFVLEGGGTLHYDAASVCLGSEIPHGGHAGNGAVRVKPVENTGEIRRRLLALGQNRAPRILIVGGGAAGCEVAANTLALLDRLGIEGEVTLAQEGESILPDAPNRAQEWLLRSLRGRGAKVLTGTPVVRFGNGVAWTSDGRELPCDLPVLAVGVAPPGIFRDSRLPTGDDGGLLVDSHLRCIGDGRLFGGGDCVVYEDGPLPRLGVFAVRQGPVIFRNLQAALNDGTLSRYRPQRRYLYVLNLGDGTGLAVYGSLAWGGRLAWRLKHGLDRRFVEGHSRPRRRRGRGHDG